jgi:hypothetical protein
MLFPEAVTFSVCPGLMSLPQEDRKALGALVVLSPSLSFANSPRSLANNFRIDTLYPITSTARSSSEKPSVVGIEFRALFR